MGTQMRFVILFSALLHCLKLKMISFSRSCKEKRIYHDPDIVLCKAPSQVWETDVEAGGREVRWTVCLAALKSIVQRAPFSHYTVVSVCLCVFYTEELDADITPWPEICRACLEA